MASLLSSVLAAVRPGTPPHDLDDVEAEPDATASIPEPPPPEASPIGGSMSVNQAEVGAVAVAAAAIPVAGTLAGGGSNSTAIEVVTSVMSAESIKGDAGRMSAAISLMALAPTLSAEAVTAFVAEHVPAASVVATAPAAQAETPAPVQSYADRRVEAARLAMPSAGGGQDDPVKRILGNYGAAIGR